LIITKRQGAAGRANPFEAKQQAVLSVFSKATLQDEQDFSGPCLLPLPLHFLSTPIFLANRTSIHTQKDAGLLAFAEDSNIKYE
jgi:hypothetical protein